jgi:hypothetical protein
MLAGCGALTTQDHLPSTGALGAVSTSWMAPGAKEVRRLLYISDIVTSDVFVYNYDTAVQVGELTGFGSPDGQCVDAEGDVWITDYNGTTIDEYAHGGTTPIKKLHTARGTGGCSVDPTTGDLAATTTAVIVWKHARGKATAYLDSNCANVWPPGYDDKGNLYVEAISQQGTFNICELPHGSKKLRTVSSNVPIVYPAGVMWDGKFLTLADQTYEGSTYSGLYRATEDASGNLKEVSGTELFTGDCNTDDIISPFIVGKKNTPLNREEGTTVLGPSLACRNQFYFWAYPAGGSPTKTLAYPALPDGQSVSIAE